LERLVGIWNSVPYFFLHRFYGQFRRGFCHASSLEEGRVIVFFFQADGDS
jgi:hypothetical protein